MDPSGKSKYLTSCRTVGLQRTQKRTPSSSGLPPLGGTACGVITPFRSPVIANSAKSTPKAEKKPLTTPNPLWSTPLLPKSRVKMGLSKPSPKTDLFAKIHSEVLIRTPVKNSATLRTTSDEQKPRNPNRLQNSILLTCAPTSSPNRTTSNDASEEDGESLQADGKIEQQSAAELSHADCEEMGPPILSPQKPHAQELPPRLKPHSIEKTPNNTLDNCSSDAQDLDDPPSQESFHGWDLENDQDSLDRDLRRDAFKKCFSNFRNRSGGMTPKVASPVLSKRGCRVNKLSFVKEKFKSKRRLLSDSDDSDGNADDISIQRKGSHCTKDPDPLSSSNNRRTPRTEFDGLTSDSVDRVGAKPARKLDAPCRRLGAEDCSAEDEQTDSEKENVDTNTFKDEFINSKNKTKSRRMVLSDSDEDADSRDDCTMEMEHGVLDNSAPDKSVLPVNSDHNFVTKSSDSVLQLSTLSQHSVPSQSSVEGDDVSDSDDDFIVRKPRGKLPKSDGLVLSSSPEKHPSKLKLVVELHRLPDSALDGMNEGVGNPGENSQSSVGKDSSDGGAEEFPTLPKNFKTYGRPLLKEEKKKPGKLSLSRRSLVLPEAKLLPCPDTSITLSTETLQTIENEDEIKRQLVEISETDDFERTKSEMQKWLKGGQQVITQIIEEVRSQRDKDMTVIEVLQEHNIDPNLVGYDPAVEEFVSFDKFLLQNGLM